MAPAISVEGQDTFDALSRGYHYSIQRLGRYVLYMVVLLFFMCVSTWFVDTFIIRGIYNVTGGAATLAGFDKEQGIMKGRYERMSAAYSQTWPWRAN